MNEGVPITDPVTVGSIVAGAIAAGATEAGKAVLGQAARDAYAKLTSAAARILGPAVGWLEKKPESDDIAVSVAEEVDQQDAAVQVELRRLAEDLRAELSPEGRATIDNRITVIATHGSIAAGHVVNVTLPGNS